MFIESIDLTNFRNFDSRKLVFSSRNIIFRGKNGTGKSNLLESIAFASLLRSFRGSSSREMIRIGAKEFHISASLAVGRGREMLDITENISGKRKLFINRESVRRSSDFIREFHTIVFAPEDRDIVAGPSGCRRRFFDILISEIEPEYMLRLTRYHRALAQRNKALKFAAETAFAFDGELAEQSPLISERRRHYAQIISEKVNSLLADKGAFRINYRTDSGATTGEHAALMASRRESELRRQITLCGVQLDDFEFFFNDKLLRTYGSTGQVRLFALLLKLAQYETVKNNSRIPLAVLADDVTGELDSANLELFLSTIANADQCFFTFADDVRFSLPDCTTIML